MIVVDSNVLAYLYLPGDYTEAEERLYQRDTAWHAPVLWRSGFRNILVGYMRRGVLTPEQAIRHTTRSGSPAPWRGT
jgi:predicted nucleic acid-binding protein